MRNACPSCQTVYAVTPADVGRRIACKTCQATLVIDADGFRLESPPPPPPPATAVPPKAKPDAADDRDEKPRRKTRDRRRDDEDDEPERTGPDLMTRLRQQLDIPTVVFAAGTVAVLVALFLPLLAKANEARTMALVQQGQNDYAAEVKRLREKANNQEAIARADETWEKRKEKLQLDSQAAALGPALDGWLHRAGLLVGFVLTALGAVGLLMSHQHTTKKVVGAVVVCAMLVVVFLNALWKG